MLHNYYIQQEGTNPKAFWRVYYGMLGVGSGGSLRAARGLMCRLISDGPARPLPFAAQEAEYRDNLAYRERITGTRALMVVS